MGKCNTSCGLNFTVLGLTKSMTSPETGNFRLTFEEINSAGYSTSEKEKVAAGIKTGYKKIVKL